MIVPVFLSLYSAVVIVSSGLQLVGTWRSYLPHTERTDAGVPVNDPEAGENMQFVNDGPQSVES